MYHQSSTSVSGIQGKILEVTVVGCNKLKDTEWISRQDPYVCVEYASTKFRTRTCTDGGKNPTFQEKFVFTLIEGLRELNVVVWNSNTLKFDDFIGSGKVQLQKVLSQGFDDSPWSIQSKTGRYAGEVRVILHYANANLDKPPKTHAPSAPPYVAPQVPQSAYYAPPPPSSSAGHYPQQPYPPPHSAYPPPPSGYPQPSSGYPQPSSGYPQPPSGYPQQPPYQSYPPESSAYPPQHSAYPPQPSAYPPQPYSSYPPSQYPPSSQPSPYYPPGPYPGMYPPR